MSTRTQSILSISDLKSQFDSAGVPSHVSESLVKSAQDDLNARYKLGLDLAAALPKVAGQTPLMIKVVAVSQDTCGTIEQFVSLNGYRQSRSISQAIVGAFKLSYDNKKTELDLFQIVAALREKNVFTAATIDSFRDLVNKLTKDEQAQVKTRVPELA